ENDNSAFATSNFSLTISNISVSLVYPLDESFVNQQTNFNCLSQTVFELVNVSFFIWNSTDLVYNLTEDISGTLNLTEFQYNLTEGESYYWNCKSYDNESSFDIGSSNYSVTYDVTEPNVSLISPDNSVSYVSNSREMIFEFNVTDNFNIANCSLIVNDNFDLTNSSVDILLTQSFVQLFSPGNYNWKIQCSDEAGNFIESDQRSFSINAPTTSSSSSGSSGGSSSSSSGSSGGSSSSSSSGGDQEETDPIESPESDEEVPLSPIIPQEENKEESKGSRITGGVVSFDKVVELVNKNKIIVGGLIVVVVVVFVILLKRRVRGFE
ncbi:hypothetical protein ACFL0X_01605, partial [Nanoarchaeota archaeon]